MAKDGLIVTEVRNKTHLDARYGALERIDERTYGDNVLDFYGFSEEGKEFSEEKREERE